MNDHLDQADLLAFLDDELPHDEKQAVADHLSMCESCAVALDCVKRQLPQILEAMREYCAQESPPAPWPSLEELLPQKAQESTQQHSSESASAPADPTSNGNRSEE